MAAYDYSSGFGVINNALANIGKNNELNWQREQDAKLGGVLAGGNYMAAAQQAFANGNTAAGVALLKMAGEDADRKSDDVNVFRGGGGGGALAPLGGGGAPPAGSGGPLNALDAVNRFESGNRNIHQNVVPAGGGYNPSTGTVTGPSSAS